MIPKDKLYTLTGLWILLQITELLYIGSAWVVVRAYFLPYDDHPPGEVNLSTSYDRETDFFCEKSTETFGLLWFSLVSFVTTISLILTLWHNRTRAMLGFFVGVSLTMSSWTLVYAIKSSHVLLEKKAGEANLVEKAAVELSSFLGFLLTALYLFFAALLFSWLEDISEEDNEFHHIYIENDEQEIFIGTQHNEKEKRKRNNTSPTVTSTSESVVQS